MKPSALVTAATLALAFTALLLSCAKKSPGSALDRVARDAIIESACRAVRSEVKHDPGTGDEVSKESWGQAISKLQPLRVHNDRMNVFIVLKEDANTEEGLYVSNPISSYAPGVNAKFVRFKKLTQSGDAGWGCALRLQTQESPDGRCEERRPEGTVGCKMGMPNSRAFPQKNNPKQT